MIPSVISVALGGAFGAVARYLVGMAVAFPLGSAFSLDTLRLVEGGRYGAAGAYVLASVLLSLIACAFGLWLAKGMTT